MQSANDNKERFDHAIERLLAGSGEWRDLEHERRTEAARRLVRADQPAGRIIGSALAGIAVASLIWIAAAILG